ncbi:MAG: ribosome silencing factor [Rubrivivax sp.]|nr:MAG: ribosome silencing factor [Rubrivivax sp.]
MDIRKLQRAIVDGLEDVKAQDIVVFNTEHLSSLFERVIIASGTSNRQTKALAASVRNAVRAEGFDVMRTEGEANGEWIIVDCAAAVVHLMQPAIRQYYQLEEIWGEKPVAIKLKAAKVGLVKASEPMDDEEDEAPKAKKSAKKKAPAAGSLKDDALKAPASRPAVKKVAAKKAAAKKAPAAKKAVSTRAPVVPSTRKPAAKKVVGQKVAAKKVPAKKAVARKAVPVKTLVINAPGKPAAKKTAARKAAPPARKSPVRKMVGQKVAAKKVVGRKTGR